jgi:Uma2 family endonuclease
MSAVTKPTWSVEAYLAQERASEQRHEYLAGQIFLMSGGSEQHSLIAGNVYASFHTQVRQRPCRVYTSHMRVKVSATGLYTYPDVSVVCGEAQFEDDHRDTLLNPTVIVEVLSPSTEAYDRGKKSQHYRALESLREYLLIAQDAQRIEQYVRQPDDRWVLSDVYRSEGSVNLVAIGCTLLLADVYERVTFGD